MEDKLIISDSPFYNCTLTERYIELFRNHKDFYIKPYLRPLSSMTEEEKKELKFLCDIGPETLTDSSWVNGEFGLSIIYKNKASIRVDAFDWLNKKMFDYRGLIEKGLAIEVTENNNPYKN